MDYMLLLSVISSSECMYVLQFWLTEPQSIHSPFLEATPKCVISLFPFQAEFAHRESLARHVRDVKDVHHETAQLTCISCNNCLPRLALLAMRMASP